jgi:hypothetical protein
MGGDATGGRPLRRAPCHYESHRATDWALPGATIWTCGVCHPPIAPLLGRVIRHRDAPGLTYVAQPLDEPESGDLLSKRERQLAERYREMYPWLDEDG